MAARGGDDVAEHGGRGLHSPGARAVEHQVARGLGLDEDGVVRAVHRGQRVVARHERRVDAGGDGVAAGGGIREALADGEQLDHVAGLAGGVELRGGEARDPLAVHGLDRHARVEGEAREDGGLLRGVVALDVGRGIRLRVAELGGGREGLVEAEPVRVHLVQDVVGRAVDDAEDPLDPVAREAVAEGPDDGDRAGHRGLVVELRAHLLGRLEELGAVRREQRLVRRDDVGARGDGREDVGAGRLDAAHQLDDDVCPEDERFRVGREELSRDGRVARCLRVAHRDAHELEPGADALRQLLAVLPHEARHLGADRAAAQQGDAQVPVLDHRAPFTSGDAAAGAPASRASRSASVSPRTMTRASPSRTATTGGRPIQL